MLNVVQGIQSSFSSNAQQAKADVYTWTGKE